MFELGRFTRSLKRLFQGYGNVQAQASELIAPVALFADATIPPFSVPDDPSFFYRRILAGAAAQTRVHGWVSLDSGTWTSVRSIRVWHDAPQTQVFTLGLINAASTSSDASGLVNAPELVTPGGALNLSRVEPRFALAGGVGQFYNIVAPSNVPEDHRFDRFWIPPGWGLGITFTEAVGVNYRLDVEGRAVYERA